MMKLCLYGYLNLAQSSRRLEREARRNTELMWLTGKLAPDVKTIADFSRDNGKAFRSACSALVAICRAGTWSQAAWWRWTGAGSGGEHAHKNFSPGAVRRGIKQGEAGVARDLQAVDTDDRQEGETAELRTGRIKDRLASLRRQVRDLRAVEAQLATAPDRQTSRTDPDARAMTTNGKGAELVVQRPSRGRRRAPSDRRVQGHQPGYD